MTTQTLSQRLISPPPRFRIRTGHAAALAAVAIVSAAAFIPDESTSPTVGTPASASQSAEIAPRVRLSGADAAPTQSFGGASKALRPEAAFATAVPVSAGRAERVASATLLLVNGRTGIERAIDVARRDLGRLGGHTVSFNETEGTPTSQDPCPIPIDAYASGSMASVMFPCPRTGEHSDAAQLVMAVPVPKVEAFLRSMGGYGEILGRSTQVTDAQRSIDSTTARISLLDRQIAALQKLIASTTGDSAALRRQLASKVATRGDLEASRLGTREEVRFAQIAMNVTTVRPAGSPKRRNGFVRAAETGWHRLLRLGQRVVSLLIVAVPVLAVLAILGWPLAGWLRRRGAPEVPQAPQ